MHEGKARHEVQREIKAKEKARPIPSTPNLQTLNPTHPKPHTVNLEPWTLNPKPDTPNPKI
jgi:hypothetical protein